MLKVAEIGWVIIGFAAVAINVYPLPVLLIHKSVKVAIPFTALTVRVPFSTPAPPIEGLVEIAIVTAAFELVIVLPYVSVILTVTGIFAPAILLLGCVPICKRLAAKVAESAILLVTLFSVRV